MHESHNSVSNPHGSISWLVCSVKKQSLQATLGLCCQSHTMQSAEVLKGPYVSRMVASCHNIMCWCLVAAASGHFCRRLAVHVFHKCGGQVPTVVSHERHGLWTDYHWYTHPAGELWRQTRWQQVVVRNMYCSLSWLVGVNDKVTQQSGVHGMQQARYASSR